MRTATVAVFLAATLAVMPACQRAGGTLDSSALLQRKLWEEFSGARALTHVAAQVAIGPRPSGSPALEQTRKYLEEQLRAVGWTVERQMFTDPTPRGPVEFTNLIARFKGADVGTPRAILCAHYDTKLYGEFRFVGANDGGSGTGALVEAARVLALEPALARRFELVFFDGEEAIGEWSLTDSLYGSRHYARDLRKTGRVKQFRFGILWDMIGDRNLGVTLPPDSPSKLARGIFAASEALGKRQFFGYFSRGPTIDDDHRPLNVAGIPTVNVIDFEFGPWHTAGDTLDTVSAESMEIVGRTTFRYLCGEEAVAELVREAVNGGR